MAVCTVISFRRQGFAFLDYTMQGGLMPHRMRFGLVYPVLPSDDAVIEPELLTLATDISAVLPTNGIIVGGGTMDVSGSEVSLYTAGYPLAGTHGDAAGAEDYYSRTVTITGKGRAVSAGACTGQTRVVLFVGKAFNFGVGATAIPYGFDPDLDAVADRLDDLTSILWSDFYGQKAKSRNKFTTQFNSYTQNHNGQ